MIPLRRVGISAEVWNKEKYYFIIKSVYIGEFDEAGGLNTSNIIIE